MFLVLRVALVLVLCGALVISSTLAQPMPVGATYTHAVLKTFNGPNVKFMLTNPVVKTVSWGTRFTYAGAVVAGISLVLYIADQLKSAGTATNTPLDNWIFHIEGPRPATDWNTVVNQPWAKNESAIVNWTHRNCPQGGSWNTIGGITMKPNVLYQNGGYYPRMMGGNNSVIWTGSFTTDMAAAQAAADVYFDNWVSQNCFPPVLTDIIDGSGTAQSRIASDINNFMNGVTPSRTGPAPYTSWSGTAPNENQWHDSLIDPNVDTDGDGHSDGQEEAHGTHPSDPLSKPNAEPDVVTNPNPNPSPTPQPAPTPGTSPGGAPTPGTGPQPAPEPIAAPAPAPSPAPGTSPDPGAAPEPPPGDDPSPNPAPQPDPVGAEQDPSTAPECYPLACEATLNDVRNNTYAGRVYLSNLQAQTVYQTGQLAQQLEQLRYQSSTLYSQYVEIDYQTAVLESSLEQQGYQSEVQRNTLLELQYQRAQLSDQLQQLSYHTRQLEDQLQQQLYQSERLAELVTASQTQEQLSREQLQWLEDTYQQQTEITDEIVADDERTFNAVELVLPDWGPGELLTSAWDAIGQQLEVSVAALVVAAGDKGPFAVSGWIPAVSLGGGSGNCPSISMSILGYSQDVSPCDTPVHTVLSTTVRSALLALLLLSFYTSMALWVTKT